MALPLSTKRRFIQILAAILLTSNITVFSANGIFFGGVCLPVIHCNACPLTWLACPIYTISEYIQFHSVPWLALGLIAGFGVLVGRFFCGWICPMGLLQELLYLIPAPKLRLPFFLRWLKYAFLIVGVGGVAYWAGKDVLYFFCAYCPPATMEVLLPSMVSQQDWSLDTWRMLRLSVLVFVLVIVVFNIRWFCKAMCPVGALVALTNKFSLFAIRLDPAVCIHCGKCEKVCPMDVPVEACSRTGRAVNRHTECIECLKCQQVCPVNAIRNNGRIPVAPPRPAE
ncbi:MAG: 4Fe-4S binding protein [Verrucomicrobia bacterium]|nr:4Fe-4S binding protein [Verrucomicrobiota bacterium]MBU4247387.1 4Fe-4S binding protein [Verrucomicrobiota bacterium]MBU4292115.1 4Fe-4S binding protein [Verrucomicrobiota bacterium]MBU4498192.1 4Fe-4S binding protein [Verrucomicrobiota bacterium]MCG2681392.1 4Fe-4S binding protein [Kiritimatiellia bacterium]